MLWRIQPANAVRLTYLVPILNCTVTGHSACQEYREALGGTILSYLLMEEVHHEVLTRPDRGKVCQGSCHDAAPSPLEGARCRSELQHTLVRVNEEEGVPV
jgi:hypothetical protein